MRLPVHCLLLALLALPAGCASLPPEGTFQQSLTEPYRVDSGDQLRVVVFEQQGLTNTYLVDQSGAVSLPLIGQVAVRDRTIEEIEAEIGRKLRAGFLRNPDVSVEIAQHRPFFVMGEVASGGQYPYVAGLTVQSAIATAGGFSPRASKGSVDITRQINGQLVTARVPLTEAVRPGDTIRVRERFL